MKETKDILTRGVPATSQRKLVRIAKKNKCSVNYLMLHAIEFYLSAASMASSPDYLIKSLNRDGLILNGKP